MMAMRTIMLALPRRAWLGGMVLVAALAACGGGGGSSGSPTPPPPTGLNVALTSPAAYATGLDGTLNLSATASDPFGIAKVEFQVDGVPVGTPTAAPYTTTLDATAYGSGQHVVRVRATSTAGQVSAWSATTVLFGGSRRVPRGFSLDETWVGGLTDATALAQVPDGRWLVAQQSGALRVVKDGVLLAAPFVQLDVNAQGERGLLGVALHPQFPAQPWVYLYYTTTQNGTHNRISRFRAAGDVAAAGSEEVLVDLPALSATNHNGGALHFGPDGKLYAGVGENAVGANAQNLASPLGKLLRFNDDGTIPADNPFASTQAGLARAIWAYGLRNPYTFAFQPETGTMFINDVGEATWEEIDVGAVGANYGWPQSEGIDRIAAGDTVPIFVYKHADASPRGSGPGGFLTGQALAGGAFYPASGNFPAAYRGSYFFADFVTRFVARLDPQDRSMAYGFASLSGSPVDLRAGLDGALYVLTRSGITRIAAQ